MIAKAMEWIRSNMSPQLHDIEGIMWADKPLQRIKDVQKFQPVSFTTLTSLVDYLKSRNDVPNDFIDHIFVSVVSPTRIEVYSGVNKENFYERSTIATVDAVVPKVRIGEWLEQSAFCILLRSCFVDMKKSFPLKNYFENQQNGQEELTADTDRDALIGVASNIVSGTIAEYQDTGISQKATLKTGIQESEDKLLPEKVTLRPYRTFLEVEQPMSEFIFRAQDSRGNGVQLALYEADGGRWKMDAMNMVKEYLMEQLKELPEVTVLA